MKKKLILITSILCGCTHAMPLSGSSIVSPEETIQADHYVNFKRGAKRQNLRTHLEVTHDEVTLIGLGMLGEVLFQCKSHVLNLNCDKVLPTIPAERLFLDIQSMIWLADKDVRFTSELFYKDKLSGYSLKLKPLDFKRGTHE